MPTCSHFHHSYHVNASHVFGQPVAQDTTSNVDKEVSDFDIIQLQRAAKRARVMATTSGAATEPGPSATTARDQSATTQDPLAATARDALAAAMAASTLQTQEATTSGTNATAGID